MAKIGFTAEIPETNTTEITYTEVSAEIKPRKSVVQVYFEARNRSYAYYNDMFDLHKGDTVYVDGKLEGIRGRVEEVNYNFKINLSDYKRVISVADTAVKGQFFIADSHFVTFDKNALPKEKLMTWFIAPKESGETVTGSDDKSFLLTNLGEFDVNGSEISAGEKYYYDCKVRYISVDGTNGYAIVEGSKPYEVEFEYRNGEVSGVVCSCYCGYNCRHEVAAILQLKETLEAVSKHYQSEYERTNYFAAIFKGTLLSFTIDNRETGSFTL